MNENEIPKFSALSDFPEDYRDEEQVKAWWKKQELQKRENYYLNNSGVGKKYLSKSIKDYVAETDEQKNILAVVKHFIEEVNNGKCRTLWLCGNTGTGKTLLGAAICRETMGTFTRSYNIKNDIESTRYYKATETKNMCINRYASAYNLLVIDEIGRGGGAEEREYLWQILNERYENELSTVLITNMSKSELKEYIGEPVYDRFVTNCISLTFTGESYRKNEREI